MGSEARLSPSLGRWGFTGHLRSERLLTRQMYRHGVPQRVRAPGFAALRTWRSLSSSKRVLPTYLILGGQRCGTTSLQAHLQGAPGVMGSFHKEVNFFNDNWAKGAGWYRAHFPSERQVESVRDDLGHRVAVGEATVYYLYHPLAARRVKQLLPHARLVVLLRDPVARAYSGYKLQVALGVEPLSFAEAIAKEDERLGTSHADLASGEVTVSASHRRYSYKARGMYADQLRVWFEHFPRESFLILSSESLFAEPTASLNRVLEFIGVPEPPALEFSRAQNVTAASPIPQGARRELEQFFREPNTDLYELLGTSMGWSPEGASS